MLAWAWTCGRSAADNMIQNCRLKSSQYTLIIFHRVIQLTTISFWVPETRLRLPQVNNNNKNPSEASEVPSETVIHFYFYFFLIHRRALCSQPIRGKVRQTGRIFPEHNERSFLDPEHSFVAVRRRPRTRFAKQKFSQLRTNYDRGTFFYIGSTNNPNYVRKADVCPVKNGL